MSTTTMAAPLGPGTRVGAGGLGVSNLTQQLDGEITPKSNKSRSLSDAPKPTLSPSPAIREPSRRVSKDDSAVAPPTTPRRPLFHIRGLSLQMPSHEAQDGSDAASNTAIPRIPLSPKLDPNPIYGSPASVLPRRSRGLDFARACTNLHHSTLAESSPDASPITGRGIQIPSRRSLGSHSVADSPSQISNPWTGERTTLSSSVSSINMMDSDSDSDSSSDMVMDEDPMLNTPAASRLNGIGVTASPGMEWLNGQTTPAQSSLLNFQPNFSSFRRARFNRHGKSSHSSSSVSMRSSKPSPGPLSPPIRPSVENPGYFGLMKEKARSRRESLSLGTDDLHLSDSEWDTENKTNGNSNQDSTPERGVIRRPVTRRSNLLPKTKGFARIRAALMEESDPLQSDARREAEVVKQVQESEHEYRPKSHSQQTDTTSEVLDFAESSTSEPQNRPTDRQPSFSLHAERNSAGLGFWNTFDHTPPTIDRFRTPPPYLSAHDSTSAMSDDFTDSSITTPSQAQTHQGHDQPSTASLLQHIHRSRSRSTTPLASANNNNPHPPSAGDVAKRFNNKRRRDDDFDPASFKRRAVSPGMSAQSSPVVPQSPTLLSLNGDKSWGRPPASVNGNASLATPGSTKADKPERSNSGGSSVSRDGQGSAGTGVKRVGLQDMTKANQGFMSMSID